VNTAPALACAVKVTTVPLVYGAAQVLPQSIPSGFDVTTPVPAPAFDTVKVNAVLKVAVTLMAALTVTVHGFAWPAQAPLHPPKTEFALGCAVNVTTVPLEKAAAQVLPQSMPAGLDVTTPAAAPVFDTVNVTPTSNVAVTPMVALMVTVHVFDWPAHAPLQPPKTEFALGCAVSVTTVPVTKRSEQSAPQLMPSGLDVTVPEP